MDKGTKCQAGQDESPKEGNIRKSLCPNSVFISQFPFIVHGPIGGTGRGFCAVRNFMLVYDIFERL